MCEAVGLQTKVIVNITCLLYVYNSTLQWAASRVA